MAPLWDLRFSPIHFEDKAFRTSPHPPGLWFRYVDDIHTKQKVEHVEEFTEHIHSIDPDIKFTKEKEENNEHKLSVVRTRLGRAKSIITEEHDLNNEMQHCHHPEWALKKGREQTSKPKPGQAKSKGNVPLNS
ncbi:hypothetical protein DPMN_192086 [Dreissena polymorpha]|uniref:Uncharacterized protein n=1 Tax=Dreissena polymorpha TaxID=45954 RepID=A0A9D4BE42_DREPO|nr:hypothetical protein DPMN_192086 [Dreissena polymorpha]